MNCEQFTSHLTELARCEPMESGLQTGCQAHLIACGECRERLAEVEFLQRTLRMMAREERRLEASPVVEYRLLAALQQQREAAAVRQNLIWSLSRLRWRSVAALLLVAGLALVCWRSVGPRDGTRSTPSLALSSPTPVAPRPITTPAVTTAVVAELQRPERRQAAQPSRAIRPHLVKTRGTANDKELLVETDLETEEVLTDYLFLNPAQRYYPLERGQLIRVLVPRSTLGSFGFPVNPERAMMPVKADLVVGEDGMARAIRFIK